MNARTKAVWPFFVVGVATLGALLVFVVMHRADSMDDVPLEPSPAVVKVPAEIPKSILHKERLDSSADRMVSMREQIVELPSFKDVVSRWKRSELDGAIYLDGKRSRGEQLIVLLPPTTSDASADLDASLTSVVNEADPTASPDEKSAMLQNLRAWFNPRALHKVLIFDFKQLEGDDHVSGRWLEIEDPNKITDKFQYIDYGNIVASGEFIESEIASRYSHLFSISSSHAR